MTLPGNPTGTEKPDLIARYFLRRLAMAHRESPSRKPSIQYTNALVETILIFVGLPMIALASIVLIPNLRWVSQILPKGSRFPQLGFAIILWTLSVVIGHLWLGPRVKKYRQDRSAFTEFASTRDARIVSWQRFIVFTVCAIVLPFLAMLFTFGTQVITRAFELN
jgi:hypothetical protein